MIIGRQKMNSDIQTILLRWRNDERYRNSRTVHGWTKEYCRYLDSIASRHGVSVQDAKIFLRLESMMDHHQDPTKLRPDFPRAVRTLAAVQHEEGWMNSYIPKHFRERQRRIDDKGRLDLEWQCWNRNVKKQRVAGFFLFFDKIGGSQENGTSHKNGNGKDSKDGENGTNKYSLSESSAILPDSCAFVVFSWSVA